MIWCVCVYLVNLLEQLHQGVDQDAQVIEPTIHECLFDEGLDVALSEQ